MNEVEQKMGLSLYMFPLQLLKRNYGNKWVFDFLFRRIKSNKMGLFFVDKQRRIVFFFLSLNNGAPFCQYNLCQEPVCTDVKKQDEEEDVLTTLKRRQTGNHEKTTLSKKQQHCG
jgi:hypothetical protein